MIDSKKAKCHVIIHGASVAAAGIGSGLAQLPGSDYIPLSAAQVAMVIALGGVFDTDITESMAKSLIATLGTTVIGRTVSQFLVGWIPVVGNAINATTAAGLTEALGWAAANHFDKEYQEQATERELQRQQEEERKRIQEYQKRELEEARRLQEKRELQKTRERQERERKEIHKRQKIELKVAQQQDKERKRQIDNTDNVSGEPSPSDKVRKITWKTACSTGFVVLLLIVLAWLPESPWIQNSIPILRRIVDRLFTLLPWLDKILPFLPVLPLPI